MDKKDLISIRNATEEDRNFILATWLRGLYYGNDWFRRIPKEIFMVHYHAIIENVLNRAGTAVRVAVLKDDASVILGYSVSRGTTVDWIFVKNSWRNIGIAKSLTPEKVSAVTHLTKAGYSLLQKHPNAVFNPFI